MQAQRPGLFPTIAQWRELRAAWRDRRTNPLRHYYGLSRRRRLQTIPMWRRALVPAVGLATGVGCAYCVVNRLGPFQQLALTASLWVYAALLMVTWPLAVWLGQVLFDSLRAAANWFSLPDSWVTDPKLDPALSASHLSGAEVVVGMLSALGWQVVWAASAMNVANMLSFLLLAGASRNNTEAGNVANLFPVSLIGMTTVTVLGIAALLLLMACAGRAVKMAVHASVLASLYAIGSLIFVLVTRQVAHAIGEGYSSQHYSMLQQQIGRVEPLPYLTLLLVLLALVLYPLYRPSATLGLFVGYVLPGLFVINFFSVAYIAETLGGTGSGFDPTHLFYDTFFAWSMFAPVSAIAVPHPACLGTGFAHMVEHPAWHQWRWPFLVVAQVVLVCGLLRCALESIALARAAGRE